MTGVWDVKWRSPRQLEALVSNAFKMGIEPFEDSVQTCFGQMIEIMDGDRWVPKIQFEHVGYGMISLPWGKPFHRNPIVEWIYRACAIERIQSHIDIRPIAGLARPIAAVKASDELSDIAEPFLSWSQSIVFNARAAGTPHLSVGVRALFQWCVERLVPGFSEADFESLCVFGGRNRSGHATTFMDHEYGPFTASELASIEQAMKGKDGWTRERALFYLCRDWGLRPIQLALLREGDFDQDDVGPFIMVPSVKGVRRSRLRRAPANMKKRYISDETAEALEAHLDNASETHRLQARLVSEAGISWDDVRALPRALFPGSKSSSRAKRLFDDDALRPYLLHCDSGRLSSEISNWGERLSLPAAASRMSSDETRMSISAYRFRRTKGTSMVITGHSPEEVAEALDHKTVATVRHYFQFNLDLIDFVNAAHNSSTEISEAVKSWNGRISSQDGKREPTDMQVAHLGICKAHHPCPHHPTVTCYACPKFRPFKEADHQTALQNIEDLRARAKVHGSGPVRNQVDAALAGARAVIQAIKNGAG